MRTWQGLIIGQGDIGLPVTNTLAAQDKKITGLARQSRAHYALDAKADFIQADALTLSAEQLSGFTHIAVIVTPDEYSASGYERSYLHICQHLASLAPQLNALERVVFISSTGVYGQDAGEWIDVHTTPQTPSRAASKVILQAEQTLQQGFGDKAVIIRPSGIYGRERLMRLRHAKETDKAPMPQAHWSNRIMDRDLVTIIGRVLTSDNPEPLYIATDYRPVTTLTLSTWLSQQLGTPVPTADSTQTAVTGKRLHSNIPLMWLAYPDWQTGYTDIMEQQQQQQQQQQ